MNPGHDLDALVAEKVMGWKKGKLTHWEQHWFDEDGEASVLPEYSTDIKCAWEVVEKLDLLSGTRSLSRRENGFYLITQESAQGHGYREVVAKAETAPHAICLAALQAVGHSFET